MEIAELVKNNIGTIIDVRSTMEFATNSVANSKNIPLDQIESKLPEIREMETPIILCCASGIRSEQATKFLLSQGINCQNGGTWIDLNFYQSQGVCPS